MRSWMVVVALSMGCSSGEPTWDGVVRSCDDPQTYMAPCEGTFTCNADCRTAVGPNLSGCISGTLFVGNNDCDWRLPDVGGAPDAGEAPDAGDAEDATTIDAP